MIYLLKVYINVILEQMSELGIFKEKTVRYCCRNAYEREFISEA
jgi:hypothetical protein